jgi:hypothetical protein
MTDQRESMDPSILYRQLGQLLGQAPNLWRTKYLSEEEQRWLGRVGAIVDSVGDHADTTAFRVSAQNLVGSLRESSIQSLLAVANRTLASLELRVPIGDQGAFVAPGARFDMHRAMADVLAKAVRDVLVVDPYIDEVFLTKFALLVPESVSIRLLGAARNKECGQRLMQALEAWRLQYGGERPIESRRANGASLHNRHFILDGGAQVWNTGQSIRNFVEHSANHLQRLDSEIANETAEHYEAVWLSSALH